MRIKLWKNDWRNVQPTNDSKSNLPQQYPEAEPCDLQKTISRELPVTVSWISKIHQQDSISAEG